MTMNEKKLASKEKELEKLEARLARENKRLEKKTAAAEKVNAVWTKDEYWAKKESGECTEEQDWAHFDRWCVQQDVRETEEAIKKVKKAIEKLDINMAAEIASKTEEARVARIEAEWITKTAEERKAEYEAWLKKFKAECRKDGIEIEEANGNWVSGKTAKGESFYIYGNNGLTTRSLHCYTLTIEGETIFTSGDFATCYSRIKKEGRA